MPVGYLWGCGVLLCRESLLVLRGQVPCGLVTYGQSCAETTCIRKWRGCRFKVEDGLITCFHEPFVIQEPLFSPPTAFREASKRGFLDVPRNYILFFESGCAKYECTRSAPHPTR